MVCKQGLLCLLVRQDFVFWTLDLQIQLKALHPKCPEEQGRITDSDHRQYMENHRTKLYSRGYSSPMSVFLAFNWLGHVGSKYNCKTWILASHDRSKVIELSALLGEELPYIVAWRAIEGWVGIFHWNKAVWNADLRFVEIRYAVSAAEVELALTTETTKLPKHCSPFGEPIWGGILLQKRNWPTDSYLTFENCRREVLFTFVCLGCLFWFRFVSLFSRSIRLLRYTWMNSS